MWPLVAINFDLGLILVRLSDGGDRGRVAKGRREPRSSRFDHQGALVELLVVQTSGGVEDVVACLGQTLDLVGGLLELTDLADDVRDLKIKR